MIDGKNRFNTRTLLNLSMGQAGYKHVVAADGKVTPTSGFISITPVDGTSATYEAEMNLGDDFPSKEYNFVMPCNGKSITVTVGEVFLALVDPNDA